MNQKTLIILFLGMWNEFENDFRKWRREPDNVFEKVWSEVDIHDFIKWLKWKQKQP